MPNTFGDADLDAMKNDPCISVVVVYGAVTGVGFDFVRGSQVRNLVGDFAAVAEETSVLVKKGDFSGLQADATITVDGTTYRIGRVEDVDDAHVERLTLVDA